MKVMTGMHLYGGKRRAAAIAESFSWERREADRP